MATDRMIWRKVVNGEKVEAVAVQSATTIPTTKTTTAWLWMAAVPAAAAAP